MNMSGETFLFETPLKLERNNWSLAFTNLELLNCILNISKKDANFSLITDGHWTDL